MIFNKSIKFLLMLLFPTLTWAQIFIPFGLWRCKSSVPYSDAVTADFSAGTFTNTNWNGNFLILSAGQSTGQFISRVFNTFSPCALLYENLSWQTQLPYLKEISNSAETGYNTSPTNFSNGLVGYWKLNELSSTVGAYNDFTDSSGSGNHGESVGGITFGSSGKLNLNITKTGGAGDYIEIQDNISLDSSNQMSFSMWIYPTTLDTTPRGILTKRVGSASNYSYGIFIFNSNRIHVDIDGTTNRFQGTTTLALNQWYHVAVVFDGTLAAGSRSKLYINGILETTASETSSTIPNYASTLVIGHLQTQSQSFAGKIDEVAIWKNRALSAAEILELYRRGANRIQFQVRSCTLFDCSDNSVWMGSDGSSATFFSEINNNTIQTSGLGSVLSASPNMNFKNFPFLILPSYSYFQYKAILETDNTTYTPELKSVTIQR